MKCQLGSPIPFADNNYVYCPPQGHLPKTKYCVYCGTRASWVLGVLPPTPGLVEIRVSTERWPGHLRLPKKKKLYLLSMIKNLSVVLFPHQML